VPLPWLRSARDAGHTSERHGSEWHGPEWLIGPGFSASGRPCIDDTEVRDEIAYGAETASQQVSESANQQVSESANQQVSRSSQSVFCDFSDFQEIGCFGVIFRDRFSAINLRLSV
jgi:hypothetical protein